MRRSDAVRRQESIAAEVDQILDHVASMPGTTFASAVAPVVRALLLKTDGQLLLCGKRWDVVAKPLGAGVYRVVLKEVAP